MGQKIHILNYLVQWRDPNISSGQTQTRVLSTEEEATNVIQNIQSKNLNVLKAVKRSTVIRETDMKW